MKLKEYGTDQKQIELEFAEKEHFSKISKESLRQRFWKRREKEQAPRSLPSVNYSSDQGSLTYMTLNELGL